MTFLKEQTEMQPIISLHSLSRRFALNNGLFRKERAFYAVRDVTLHVMPGETLGVVGESGSGKSTLGRMAVGLLEPSAGEARMKGVPFSGAGNGEAAKQRAHVRKGLAGKMQMIFQDPYSSLNPRMRIGKAVGEPLLYTDPKMPADERGRRVREALAEVGLDAEQADRYPHEFSGGQRQRIAVARALITRPEFVVCDEPTSSLDASVQAQVLNLLKDMQDALGLAYLFISHDLAVIRHMADRAAVMYQGLVVEEAAVEDLFARPLHPYTQLLLRSCPGDEQRQNDEGDPVRPPLSGTEEVDDRHPDMPPLCPFYARCPRCLPMCREARTALLPAADADGHKVRCLLYGEV